MTARCGEWSVECLYSSAGVSLRLLLPAARRLDAGKANAGFAFGVVFAAVALASLGALCWQTPYCDRRW
jgi:hypothetical protein